MGKRGKWETMRLVHRHLRATELVPVDESAFVFLGSGGPAMRVVCLEGEMALCEIDADDDGKGERVMVPVWGLRKMRRLTRREVERLR